MGLFLIGIFVLLIVLLLFWTVKAELKAYLSPKGIGVHFHITLLHKRLFYFERHISTFENLLDSLMASLEPSFDLSHLEDFLSKQELSIPHIKKSPQYKLLEKTIHINKLTWNTNLGFGDAAITATCCGLAWTIKGMISHYAKQLLNYPPSLHISPDYTKNTFSSEVMCIFSFKLGKAIVTAYKLSKYRKGRRISS
ncbi:DUF2953 domain-containing protein [Terrilactibacillus tamarindi]|uniref:DUF2953 domain-containing protein n=1 Tax=Terrilactibacillus tamarindi TaxID=2599694 RepID=UPI0018AD1046|nr:DUF2953 domain-containing protein [Terrilactibacillus tamarindi]